MKENLSSLYKTIYESESEVYSNADPFQKLSPREREMLELVVSGATNKAIADNFSIAENTVRNHVANIYKKLKVNNRTEAAFLYHKKVIEHHKAKSSEPEDKPGQTFEEKHSERLKAMLKK